MNDILKPFLRWAGGKNWLIKHLNTIFLLPNFKNYHEPFLGGASLFFSINPKHESYLSDLNQDLVDTYITLRDYSEEVIEELSTFQNNETFYYHIRSAVLGNPISKAARFIFLNQTSFNGIYRVNLKGEYNVPYGYRTKEFFDPTALKKVSSRLKGCHIKCCDFSDTLNNIAKGDLVFLDPPYTVSHNNNGFVKYNQKLFSLSDQFRLSNFIDQLKEREVYYILSNAFHPTILKIFDKKDTIFELNRSSIIGGRNANRGKIAEYLFTNITT